MKTVTIRKTRNIGFRCGFGFGLVPKYSTFGFGFSSLFDFASSHMCSPGFSSFFWLKCTYEVFGVDWKFLLEHDWPGIFGDIFQHAKHVPLSYEYIWKNFGCI